MYRSVSKLSQAAAHPRRGTTLLVMEFFLQGMNHMLHNQSRKSKGEIVPIRLYFKILPARNPATGEFHAKAQRRREERKEKSDCPLRPFSASLRLCVKFLLVGFLANESRHVEVVDARSAHHWPREIVGRPRYETWRRRGNRSCRGGRRN